MVRLQENVPVAFDVLLPLVDVFLSDISPPLTSTTSPDTS